MPAIPPIKGTRLRATKINSCGKPVSGNASRLVTSGFVTATLTPVLQEAQDLTQQNAEGKECFSDRTPPERRWYTAAIELCMVNTGIVSMFTGWETVLNALGLASGIRDQKEIESDYGVALEIWTSGKMDDDCADIPTVDGDLDNPGTGKSYGYFLFGGTEWVPGDLKISAAVSTLTLTGRTIAMPGWGLGPYNVAEDEDGTTARRLISPTTIKEHLTLFRTLIAPPDETPGAEPVALAIGSLFTGTNYYYGGPANAAPIDIAPEQGSAEGHTVTVTGTPAGGTFTLKVNGVESGTIAYNAIASAVKTALVAIDDGYTSAMFTVTGGALPGAAVVITTTFDADIEVGTNSLTGGTAPAVTVT